MNQTNFEHAAFAVLMQCVIGFTTGNWLAGACFGAAFFLGREHCQAQKSLKLGDFAAFDMRKWELDAKLDLAFPFFAVTIVYLIKELS